MIHLLALGGVLSISFSAVFVRLAAVSPVTAAFYRAAYAVPVLLVIRALIRATDRRPLRDRLLAGAAGILLAFDLALWHVSIAMIGAGLATVIANVQVVFVAAAAWAMYGERPSRGTALVIAAVLTGVALTSGMSRPEAYGDAPVLGVLFGVTAGGCYSGFLLTFRAANRTLAPAAGPLLDATMGTVIGALLCLPFDSRAALAPHFPAHYWLALMAMVSQVIGWLLIATALPRLPAVETSILLLGQPVFALMWGLMLFAEHLSQLQWLGSALILAGVATIAARRGGALRRAPIDQPPMGDLSSSIDDVTLRR
jgi:drug/metabolite transporter (DMT)-like permease